MVSVSPASGSTIPIPTEAIPFEVVVPEVKPYAMSIEVATQDIPGQDGSLANDFRLDSFSAFKSDAYPTIYRGKSYFFLPGQNSWPTVPGTYYWQISASYLDTSESLFKFRQYLSPVYTLTIAAPAPTPETQSIALTASEAYRAVREAIEIKTGAGHVHHLTDKCHVSGATATCKTSWTGAYKLHSNTWIYAGTFRLEANTEETLFSFSGDRATYGCVRQHGASRCAKRVHW